MPSQIDGRCIECGDVINHPLCPTCLEEEMKEWLSNKSQELVEKVERTSGIFPNNERDIFCLNCGEGMGVCAHCYRQEIRKWVVRKDNKLAEEFNDFFKF